MSACHQCWMLQGAGAGGGGRPPPIPPRQLPHAGATLGPHHALGREEWRGQAAHQPPGANHQAAQEGGIWCTRANRAEAEKETERT